jgi:phosphoribosyl 1,2-cyclic phosphodiesterase
MSESIHVTFWGVRGSYPAPGMNTAQVGGNTSCIRVQAGKHSIILDAGTGIIGLGSHLARQYQADKKPISATLLFTHTHHDHTQGFPFFAPMHFQTTTLYIFGPRTLEQDLHEVLSRAMLPPVFPIQLDQLPCVRVVRNLCEGEWLLLNSDGDEPHVLSEERDLMPGSNGGVHIHALRSYAHPQGVYVYRIEYAGKSVVYATDTEGYVDGDQRLIRFVRDASVLIHDSQYTESEYLDPMTTKQGWGHSTWQMAVGVAQAAKINKLVLFHHDPEHGDEMLDHLEKETQTAFPNTVLAREGMQITL